MHAVMTVSRMWHEGWQPQVAAWCDAQGIPTDRTMSIEAIAEGQVVVHLYPISYPTPTVLWANGCGPDWVTVRRRYNVTTPPPWLAPPNQTGTNR